MFCVFLRLKYFFLLSIHFSQNNQELFPTNVNFQTLLTFTQTYLLLLIENAQQTFTIIIIFVKIKT